MFVAVVDVNVADVIVFSFFVVVAESGQQAVRIKYQEEIITCDIPHSSLFILPNFSHVGHPINQCLKKLKEMHFACTFWFTETYQVIRSRKPLQQIYYGL